MGDVALKLNPTLKELYGRMLGVPADPALKRGIDVVRVESV